MPTALVKPRSAHNPQKPTTPAATKMRTPSPIRIAARPCLQQRSIGSLGPARLMARRVDLAGATKFLDVGGSGAYTLAFLKQNPKLRATILDFPETIQTAQRYASEAG